MAWTSGFFNSNNGDRLYTSDQLSSMFKGLITDGVYESVGNKLAVQPNNGMTIQINTGRGWFYDKWAENDSPYLLTLEPSDVTLNRYAAVGVKVDINQSVRDAVPFVKYSTFATAPTKPTPERSEKIKEYILGYVYIKAGVSEITASVIEDARADINVCGWVTGLIKQIDANTLFEQYDAIFKEWFNTLTDYLDADVETKLVNDVLTLKQNARKNVATLAVGSWVAQSDGTFKQTVEVNGVDATSDLLIAPVNETAYINANCKATYQDLHSITFICDVKPSADISVEIIIFNIDHVADVIVESVNTFTVRDDNNGNVTITG